MSQALPYCCSHRNSQQISSELDSQSCAIQLQSSVLIRGSKQPTWSHTMLQRKEPPPLWYFHHYQKKAAEILNNHNRRVLDIYTGYVSTFVDQHVHDGDRRLPFSEAICGGDKSAVELGVFRPKSPKSRITSPFYALSGHNDQWNTVSDLSEMVRKGVWLEESVIPYVAVSAESHPLNAYLFDFFKHGNVQQLESANGIRRGDIWFLLNDFSMVLATITTSLEGFLNPQDSIDMDMLNVAGSGDANDFEIDNNERVTDEGSHMGKGSTSRQPGEILHIPAMQRDTSPQVHNAQKIKTTESWGDDLFVDPGQTTVDEGSNPCLSKIPDSGLDSHRQQIQGLDKSHGSLVLVCKAFKELKNKFDQNFKEMWA